MSLQNASPASCSTDPGVEEIEAALAQARDLKAWWGRVEAGLEPVERFALFPAEPGSEPVWGFFGVAPVEGRPLSVMGVVRDDFFDRPRVPPAQQSQAARWMAGQIEEFALHYWLRAGASALPEPYPELGHATAAPYLSWLSLCFPADQSFSGAAYTQRLFKPLAGGPVGAFPPRERTAIVDLRELGRSYEWITLNVRSFDFNITVGGIGDDAPSFVLPLTTNVQSVMSADLIENRRDPEPGTLASFGPGFGFIRAENPGVLALAPERIRPGFRQQTLRVLETGEVRSRTLLIVPRPDRLMQVAVLDPDLYLGAADFVTLGASRGLTGPLRQVLDPLPLRKIGFDPVFGFVGWLNLMTGNRAATELCISREQIDKEILAKDARAAQQAVLAARQTWLQVPDWLDSGEIPSWVVRGEAA